MVWYSHLLKNFPQFVVIHTVEGFCIVNEAEIDVFLEFSCFFCDPLVTSNLTNLTRGQLEHLEVLGSCTVEACLGEF